MQKITNACSWTYHWRWFSLDRRKKFEANSLLNKSITKWKSEVRRLIGWLLVSFEIHVKDWFPVVHHRTDRVHNFENLFVAELDSMANSMCSLSSLTYLRSLTSFMVQASVIIVARIFLWLIGISTICLHIDLVCLHIDFLVNVHLSDVELNRCINRCRIDETIL